MWFLRQIYGRYLRIINHSEIGITCPPGKKTRGMARRWGLALISMGFNCSFHWDSMVIQLDPWCRGIQRMSHMGSHGIFLYDMVVGWIKYDSTIYSKSHVTRSDLKWLNGDFIGFHGDFMVISWYSVYFFRGTLGVFFWQPMFSWNWIWIVKTEDSSCVVTTTTLW